MSQHKENIMKEDKILIKIPTLNMMEVVIDFSDMTEGGYSVEYEPSKEFSDEEVKTEITEYVNSILHSILEEYNDQ